MFEKGRKLKAETGISIHDYFMLILIGFT